MRKNLSKCRNTVAAFSFLFLVCFAAVTNVSAVNIYAVTNANQLLRFDSATPGTATTVGPITGLQSGEDVLALDARPATGRLYGLGSNSRIYLINAGTGAATFVATISTALSGTSFGFDFNPTVDRIRIVSNTGQNLRVNPGTGAATVDGVLNPGTPSVTAAGYTNSVFGATATTLYTIDTANNNLYTQNPPNNGTLVLVGPTGLTASAGNGFDIAPNTNIAYYAATNALTTNLYTVNLTSGTATLVGPIGAGLTAVRGIAVEPGLVGSSSSITLDFDGDRKTDFSVFRFNSNTFNTLRSSNLATTANSFGDGSTDTVTPGDYDGDGKTDIAVWRGGNGYFYVLRSSDGILQQFQFGSNGDEPVARDYDGDGRTDYAVVRRAGGQMIWYIANSIAGNVTAQQFGADTDFTATGDYDGDGRFDLGVYRGSGSQPATFYIQRSSLGLTTLQWGLGSDLVVPGD
jgi:hypothetical protein